MASLEVRTGAKAGQRLELAAGEFVIGRYPFCDLVVDEHTVSRQHTRIVRGAEGYYAEDMGSQNGTFVNGQRVEGRQLLRDRDRIHVYETLLVFSTSSDSRHAATIELAQPSAAEKPKTIKGTADGFSDKIVNTLDASSAQNVDLHAQEKLRAVLEITRSLGSTLDVEEVIPKILDALFDIFPQSDRGYIMFAEGDDDHLVMRDIKCRSGQSEAVQTLGPISNTIAERVMSRGEAVLSADAFTDKNIDVSDSVLDFPTRSMMCAPLLGPSGMKLGIIYVDTTDPDRRFFQEDLAVLLSVAAVAGQAIEYARQHEANVESDRRERELAMAREAQLHFLPQQVPEAAGYTFFDFYQSAQEVGGDHYGYTTLPDARLAISIGDVAGKGVSAALWMARLCSDVRYCLATRPTPADAVTQLNRELTVGSREPHFITFCLCVLDPQQHRLDIVNAGHMDIIRSRAGAVEELAKQEAGMPLGVQPGIVYRPFSTGIEPGDVFVMFTDGIHEAMNRAGETYGLERLRACIGRGSNDAAGLGQHILADVRQFADGNIQSDDICLICFGRDAAG